MNINNVNRGLAVYQNSSPVKPAIKARKLLEMGNDTMTLSGTAKDFKFASEAVKNSPDIRADKLSKLKEQFATDSYKVNFDDISEQILKTNFDALSF